MLPVPMGHLETELRRLDLLLHREILRLRASYQLSLDEFRGLYISDEQVDGLILKQANDSREASTLDALNQQVEELRARAASNLEGYLPWARLVSTFDLDPAECDFLLIALAPEFDLKYETIYAYLNNDVTRKWPTVDLALRLASPTSRERPGLGRFLGQDSRLFASSLLQPLAATAERVSWLSTGFRAAPHLARFMLGESAVDPRLAAICRLEACSDPPDWEKLPVSAQVKAELQRVGALLEGRRAPMFVFLGRHGAGRGQAAGAVCASLGLTLLRVDLATAGSRTDIGPLLTLQVKLSNAGVYLQNTEALFDREGNPTPESRLLMRALAGLHQPVFLQVTPGYDWRALLEGIPALPFSFSGLEHDSRLHLWRESLKQVGFTIPAADLESLAGRFVLSPGQIREAVALAAFRQALRGGSRTRLSFETMLEAAREASGQGLGQLAVKLETVHDWDDLVLPVATLRQAHEVTAAIRNYHLIYDQWGFKQRLSSGQGLKVLFSGASGTGKTMTAGVIARDLGLDIYKIDLSSVVSKYIGETEKNLERIFRAAESSNAILFFDEADALFGKRSEVKDAHDRYANVEVAYLLQRIEEHQGVVILASNLSQNIDEAFARRMHYVIEFPLPDETHREKLWYGMFPPQAPLGEDVDFQFLARQFALPGGDIRNVSLEAAFLAAQDGRVIRMQHLVRAMARQMLKQGKLPSPADFKQHYALTAEE